MWNDHHMRKFALLTPADYRMSGESDVATCKTHADSPSCPFSRIKAKMSLLGCEQHAGMPNPRLQWQGSVYR